MAVSHQNKSFYYTTTRPKSQGLPLCISPKVFGRGLRKKSLFRENRQLQFAEKNDTMYFEKKGVYHPNNAASTSNLSYNSLYHTASTRRNA
jgi:hypothetical protein